MLGAIIGDLIGSRFERNNTHSKDFNLFDIDCRLTDDSILTFAVADAYMNKLSYHDAIYRYGNKFPEAGYGAKFRDFLNNKQNPQPYNSWGNGSAMRVSALAWLIDDITVLLDEARKSAEVTHNHPEGIKGAQAIALCILLARKGYSKNSIKATIEKRFEYDLDKGLDYYRQQRFDVSCQGSVPQAIESFLESTDFVDCLRTAISTGGDSDTVASMACAIGEAFYDFPNGDDSDLFSYFCRFVDIQHPHLSHIYSQYCDVLHKKQMLLKANEQTV